MGGGQIGNGPVDAAHDDQPRIPPLHGEQHRHHAHGRQAHDQEIPVGHAAFHRNGTGQAGGDNPRDAVAGDDHTSLYRRKAQALGVTVGPGGETHGHEHEHKAADAQQKLLLVGEKSHQPFQQPGLALRFGGSRLRHSRISGGDRRRFLRDGLYEHGQQRHDDHHDGGYDQERISPAHGLV